jgi:hypothetical protein
MKTLVANFFSQSLLTICLEDYWAAYDKSGYVADGFFLFSIFLSGIDGTALREEGNNCARVDFHWQGIA